MNVEDVKKLTVEKLKVELKSRDLDISGKKAELAERLEAHLQAQPEPSAKANGASTSAPTPAGSSPSAPGKARQPIVWNAAPTEETATESEAPAAAAAENTAAAEPANTDNAETEPSAEATEVEKQKARAKKFGVVDAIAKESVKRKAEDPEAVALVSDDIIAKRQARFKTKEEAAEEQRKQRFMDPDTVKATERKERFGKWLPQASGKTAQEDVAAAIGTALDNSVPAKGRGRGRPAAGGAPKEEKYSAEFTAKAEARKARFAGKT